MKVIPVSEVLDGEGLEAPDLEALFPDQLLYKVALFQPKGAIAADPKGVRNQDHTLAKQQHSAFLADAIKMDASLAITPEYSMPWSVLVGALQAGKLPGARKLWVLGCESIPYSALQKLRAELKDVACIIFESLTPDNDRFVDPLVYVFCTNNKGGKTEQRPVVLIQFKTTPMADGALFEVKHLQTGNIVYQFGSTASLRLLSIICSDAFALNDDCAASMYDRAIIIHIQLNAKPRHPQYRLYRDKLLGFSGDQTELVCLNWAANVEEWTEGKQSSWKNISGSGWYLRPDHFDDSDPGISANHKLGLYYTWLVPLRFHALFFNYSPAVFVLETSKVAHIGVKAVRSRRVGPKLKRVLGWDDASSSWLEHSSLDDGFTSIAREAGAANTRMLEIAQSRPVDLERLLALSVGEVGISDDWHRPRRLDSCTIDTTEVVKRITFCQDTDAAASKFRIGRLKLVRHLVTILENSAKLPIALRDFEAGYEWDWMVSSPHQNAKGSSGAPATVVYVGELLSIREIEATQMRLSEWLQRSAPNPNKAREAVQRLAVWYQEDGQVKLFNSGQLSKIDDTGPVSAFDIARES
jgi:hypothetical protein